MAIVETISLTIPTALFLGLAFGAGPCNLTCLPYLGPTFVASEGTANHAWRTVIPFSAGRLTGYSSLGLAAGFLGSSLNEWFKSPVVGWVLGGATILVGLSLLWKRHQKIATDTAAKEIKVSVNIQATDSIKSTNTKTPSCVPNKSLPGGLFVMGAGMALNPCAPLATILIAASATGSAIAGLGLGLGFGVGAVLIPSFIFGIGVAHFGRQLRLHMENWKGKLEISASMLLIIMGLVTALGWIRP